MTDRWADASNPFLAHRHHLDLYHRARAAGLDDLDYAELVTEADRRVAAVDGTGFVTTPVVVLEPDPDDPLAAGWPRRRPVVAKVETANVGGSHKARHLFGLLLGLLVEEASAGGAGSRERAELAIASCGNAALGAAVVAASAGRRLRVFVPVDANQTVVDRLHRLGAMVETCPRVEGESGDPCVHALNRAVADGARPFTVQGPRCPAVIDGARTLGLELADQLDGLGLTAGDLYVQIGGGALATAVMDGMIRARPHLPPPRLHPVQATAAHPYVAAWRAVAPAVLAELGVDDPGDDRTRAEALARRLPRAELAAALDRRAHLVTPWPGTPTSVAGGILDDVPYDWRTVMAHQISTGGWPVLADEATLERAAALAASLVTPPPDATGAAGLAGLLVDQGRPDGPIDGPGVAGPGRPPTLPTSGQGASVVLLTGVDRRWG